MSAVFAWIPTGGLFRCTLSPWIYVHIAIYIHILNVVALVGILVVQLIIGANVDVIFVHLASCCAVIISPLQASLPQCEVIFAAHSSALEDFLE